MKHPVIAAIARIDGAAVKILRMGIAIVFIWIGSLKFFAYEAESLAGSILILLMTLGTLSFLFTTPESWVPSPGDAQHGFPYLSGRGRLVVKDVVILGAALVTMSDTAKLYLKKHSN